MVITDYFICLPEELTHLSEKDPSLGEFIKKAGCLKRKKISDPFTGLVNIIIGQQISNSAKAAIWNRLRECSMEITPASMLKFAPEELRGLGISRKKAAYIQAAAQAFAIGDFTEKIFSLPDEQLINKLTKLPGIGEWSAEMLLIFTLGRRDILSMKDLAIRRGLRMLHSLDKITSENFTLFKKLYSPYCSAASLYLWELASGKYKEYIDPVLDQSPNKRNWKPAKS